MTKQSGRLLLQIGIAIRYHENRMFKALESIPLFKDVDAAILHVLEPLVEFYSCSAGDLIFEQGDISKYLYLILRGTVEVRYKPYDGPSITVTTLGTGAMFGWSAAIGNAVYTSSAICKEDCQTLRLSGKELRDLCMEQPEAGRIILDRLAESVSARWTDAQAQIQSLLAENFSTNGQKSHS